MEKHSNSINLQAVYPTIAANNKNTSKNTEVNYVNYEELSMMKKITDTYIVTIKISSAAKTGLLFASDLAITISNLGKRTISADEILKEKIQSG